MLGLHIYLNAIVFLFQHNAVLWQSQLAQPAGNGLVLHDNTWKHKEVTADAPKP